jgi:hypothetical protein
MFGFLSNSSTLLVGVNPGQPGVATRQRRAPGTTSAEGTPGRPGPSALVGYPIQSINASSATGAEGIRGTGLKGKRERRLGSARERAEGPGFPDEDQYEDPFGLKGSAY